MKEPKGLAASANDIQVNILSLGKWFSLWNGYTVQVLNCTCQHFSIVWCIQLVILYFFFTFHSTVSLSGRLLTVERIIGNFTLAVRLLVEGLQSKRNSIKDEKWKVWSSHTQIVCRKLIKSKEVRGKKLPPNTPLKIPVDC